MTNPLQTSKQTPNELGYIPTTNRHQTLHTHPHTSIVSTLGKCQPFLRLPRRIVTLTELAELIATEERRHLRMT